MEGSRASSIKLIIDPSTKEDRLVFIIPRLNPKKRNMLALIKHKLDITLAFLLKELFSPPIVSWFF